MFREEDLLQIPQRRGSKISSRSMHTLLASYTDGYAFNLSNGYLLQPLLNVDFEQSSNKQR